jgi:hypothetical protein
MFRSFSRLHTRVLLRRQDELVQLEQRLDQLDRRESETDPYFLTTNRRYNSATAERQALLSDVEAKLQGYGIFFIFIKFFFGNRPSHRQNRVPARTRGAGDELTTYLLQTHFYLRF